jgi:hypothetical protein
MYYEELSNTLFKKLGANVLFAAYFTFYSSTPMSCQGTQDEAKYQRVD